MAKEENREIKNLYGTFVFIGKPIINADKFYNSGESEGGFKYHKVQFGISTNDSNKLFVELSGGYNTKKDNKIFAFDTNNNKLEINWGDRFNKNIINQVADTKKFILSLNSTVDKEGYSCLSQYDAVEYIKENLTSDKRIVVVGNIKIDRYENSIGQQQVSIKYIPQKIRLAKDEEENKAEATIQFVFDKNSWDESRLKEEMKVDIIGYNTVYEKGITPPRNIFVPFNYTLDFGHLFNNSKVNLSNEQKITLINMYKKYFIAKTNQYFETQWKCEVHRGIETKEITMEDLSPDQRALIELGVIDFQTVANEMRRRLAGDMINEIKLIRPTMKYMNEKTEMPEPNSLTEYKEEDFIIPTFEEETLELGSGVINEDKDLTFLNTLFPESK